MSASPKDSSVLQAVRLFKKHFQTKPEVAVFAPGRANLIGEHTDYNEGFVLPFALPNKTVIVASKSSGPQTTVISAEFENDQVQFTIDKSLSKGSPAWADYVKGTIFQYLEDLPKGAAFNAVIISTVPLGSGLSSSASLEVATATLLETLYSLKTEIVTKALRCQKAEHTFAGCPCGIMDQFISTFGKDGHLVQIDCRSNTPTLVPFGGGSSKDRSSSAVILITNSKVKHALTGSEYPDRVRQCQEAVKALQKINKNVKSLRDADLSMLQAIRSDIPDVTYRRAKHVIEENRRTLDAVEALKKSDYKTVGTLMTASHESLKNDYEVSCEEIDFLVKCALTCHGVYGSRITGGGFGGCTVTLVDKNCIKEVEHFLRESYWKQYHKQCEFVAAVPSAGAGVIDLSLYDTNNNSGSISSSSYADSGSAVKTSPSFHVIGSAAVVVGVLAIAAFAYLKTKP